MKYIKNVLSLKQVLSMLNITEYEIPENYQDRALFNKGGIQHLIAVGDKGISLNSGKPGKWLYHSRNNSYAMSLADVQEILSSYKDAIAAAKHNYITQDQLNSIMAEFIKNGGGQTFEEFFKTWVLNDIPPVLQEYTKLTPAQHTFVANVLTILNQAGV